MTTTLPSRRSGALRLVLAAASIATLAGCQSLQSSDGVGGLLTPYKMEIVQGNVITSEQAAAIKPGINRTQVRDVLGSPLLADPFHASRWDYLYIFARQGQVLEQRQFAVYFVSDKLARWEGDEAPPNQAEVARLGGGDAILDKSLSIAPKTGDDNWLVQWLKKMGWIAQ